MKSKNLLNSNIEFVRPSLTMEEVIDNKIKQHVAEGSDDAFFVCDLGDVAEKFKVWNLVFPRIKPFYAVKCNDDLVLLELLALLGAGFDCASKSEIEKVMSLGVDPDHIVYANPCKQASYVKFAKSVGVDLMTFDNENELRKIATCFPDARLLLRLLPPATEKVQCVLGNKFGCPADDCTKLLKLAKELNLNVVGVSFHVGSGCYDAKAFRHAVEDAHKVFNVAADMGFHFNVLDVGGGFPGTDNAKITIHEIAAELNSALDELFPQSSGVELIAEPGRFFTASAYTLTTHVIAKRKVNEGSNTEEPVSDTSIMYYVNDGVYGSFNCLLYDHADIVPTVPASCRHAGRLEYNSSVWGPTCDGLDCLIKNFPLPELDDGDWIYFPDMGSYTLAAGSCFNGIPRPRVYYIAEVNLPNPFGHCQEISAECQFSLHMQSGHCLHSVIKPLPLCQSVNM